VPLEPELLLEELELLLEELEELLLEEDELEVLLLLDVDVMPLELLLEELDELLLDEELELEELLLDEEVELVVELVSPVQVGAAKVPSWLPWKPNVLLAVVPGAGSCQSQQLVNWKVVPGLVPVRVEFHWVVTVTVSGKVSVTVQPVSAVVPELVTLTST
jgi:hypothetical protein